jgi:flavorubredoxin
MYASAYGNTAALAQAISRGLVKAGVAVNTVNLEVTSLDDVVAAVKASDGFTIGSPTLGGHMPTPVQVRERERGSTAVCHQAASVLQRPCGASHASPP